MRMYMERTLADCPLVEVPLGAGCALRPLVAGEEGIWTRIQHGVFAPESHQTYEVIYGEGECAALDVFFATCGGRAVGIAAGVVRRTEAGTTYGYIDWVGVLDAYRGKRLGAALTVACLNFLAAAGLRHTGLWTQENRLTAVALYEKNGFVKVPLPDGVGTGDYRQQRADAGFPPLA